MIKNILKKIKFEDVKAGTKYMVALVICKLFGKYLPSDIWLISERGDEARDNAYHLYKYIRENHADIKCFYLIKHRSVDYQKIKKYNLIIEYGSLKHFIYYIKSKVCISTHIYRYIPDYRVTQRLDGFFKMNKVRVFLQHGIIQGCHPYLSAKSNQLDLFCCGARKECEYIKESLGYKSDVAICTGLARYDELYDFKVKNQILLMPTWRGDLYLLSDDEFIKTDYYKAFQSIINSDMLFNKMQEIGYELVFYPHYEMQKFIHLFQSKFNNIIIAEHEKYDVQKLLKESSILITDYSSVFFDFAYMKKPIIYYQFDKEIYHQRHYEKGYFDYEYDGFGEVVVGYDIIAKLIEYMDKPDMLDIYKERVDSFFGVHDQNNCKRIFEIIERKVK